MKNIYLRDARNRSLRGLRKMGASLLVMGLALSASAKDAVPVSKDGTPADAKPAGKEAPVSQVTAKPVRRTVSRARRWLEVGVASWYGGHFQGRTTAAGERFDMNQMTCAHPTLPMGTWLRVTNLRNRRTTFVRVNDRGPVVEGRIVDLSFAAAQALGLAGIGQVRLEAVRENDPELAKALVAKLQLPLVFDNLAMAH